MIVIAGGIQVSVRIDMTMPQKPDQNSAGDISPWEREAYGEGGRFGSMTSIPSGDPSKDRITVSFSGCGYNVAKYLSRKGCPVSFITVTGDDPLGMAAVADLEGAGVDVIDAKIEDSMTSVRVEARNFLGDTEFWRVDERILDKLSPEMIAKAMDDVKKAEVAFADGNLSAEALSEMGRKCKEKNIGLYFDPASLEGAKKGSEALGFFSGVMPGRREAEIMSGLDILSADQMHEAGTFFETKGIDKTIITIKGGGLYYKEGEKEGTIRPERKLSFAETSGAGDIVTAELLAAFAEGRPIEEAARAGMDGAARFLKDAVDERPY